MKIRPSVSKSKAYRLLAILLILTLLSLCPVFSLAAGNETPAAVFTGSANSTATLKNLDFTDLKSSSSLLKEAIYESSALGSMKGYGSKKFSPGSAMSKVDVISALYRAFGQEAAAQQAGQTINNAKAAGDKKTDALSIWADGYLQLASNDGLISAQDLSDALNTDQTTLAPESFHRNGNAQRQEMAYWLGKLLEKGKSLTPVYDQQKLFNSFNDWKKADPTKVPYLEAIVQNSIMNGDGSGNFNPAGAVTRGQASQVLKNAEDLILPTRGYTKYVGTVEDISNSASAAINQAAMTNSFYVRNADGLLYQIDAEVVRASATGSKNEVSGTAVPANFKNLVVYKNGTVGNSGLLQKGDRIEYIVSNADNTVQFVNDFSSVNNTVYYVATINDMDTAKLLMNVTPLLKLDYPDVNTGNVIGQSDPETKDEVVYKYSNNVQVLLNGADGTVKDLSPGMDVIITVRNNMITEIRSYNEYGDGVGDVVKGIVEDNNPELGYITLYSENGNGSYPGSATQQYYLRTYNYGSQSGIDVTKNHEKADLEDIETGDTVFLKLDASKNVTALSAMDNLSVKYGKVLSAKAKTLSVQYDQGGQQVLDVDKNVFVVQDNKGVSYSRIKDGDRVKLLLQITNKGTKLKQVTIEGNEHFITNIYKGTITNVDNMGNSLLAQNLQVFRNGQWVRTDQKGFTSLDLADGYSLYFNNAKVTLRNANKNLKDNEAYIAVEKDYGGKEKAVLVTYRNEDDKEDTPYNDSVATFQSGTDQFTLSKSTQNIKFGDGTIVVKDGRLVSGSSITPQDMAYVVANRSYDNGDYNAGVVQISDRSGASFAQIYRGRIQKINENKDFTVESFSQLQGQTWQYSNTPKTFTIKPSTLMLDSGGVMNQRDFIDYGTSSFKDMAVYIIADGTDALMVSTVPYGIYNAKGSLYDITGGTTGVNGDVLTEPTGIKVRYAKVYDLTTHLWVDSKDMTLNILKNTIVLKDNQIANPSDLKIGDSVRIIKKDNTETGDTYIIMVEN